MRLRNLSSIFIRRPSLLLREINANASMVQWSHENPVEHIFDDRFDMYDFLNREVLKNSPIDYLEFGVHQGNSIREWARLNTSRQSRFYGFDSFEGLPDDWTGFRTIRKKGYFSTQGQLPSIDDNRIEFIKGWFQNSLSQFLQEFQPRSRLVIHHDSDIYESTLYCLTQVDKITVPGTILVFDEFYVSSHEYQAFIDYSRSYMREYSLLAAVDRNPYSRIAIEMT